MSLKKIALVFMVGAVVTFQASASPKPLRSLRLDNPIYSLTNPGNPFNLAVISALYLSLDSAERLKTHSGEGDLFRYPSVFMDYNFNNMQDDRFNGADTDTHTLTLGGDFVTAGDLILGGMVSWSNFQSDVSSGIPDDNGDIWSFTVYGTKAIAENLYAGSSLTYSRSNSASGSDTDSYAVAPYLSYVVNMENVKLSITPTYSLSYSDLVVGRPRVTDSSTRGEFLLALRATYSATENVDVYVGATMHQVVHSRLMSTENGQDHNWYGTCAGIKWQATEMVSLDVSIGYDAFNKHYDNNLNARVGGTILF